MGFPKVRLLKADGTRGVYDLKSLEDPAYGSNTIWRFDTSKGNTNGTGFNNASIMGAYSGTLDSGLVGKVFQYIINEDRMTVELRGNKSTVSTRTMNGPALSINYARSTTIAPIIASESFIVNNNTSIFVLDGNGDWRAFNVRNEAPSVVPNLLCQASMITTWKRTGDAPNSVVGAAFCRPRSPRHPRPRASMVLRSPVIFEKPN